MLQMLTQQKTACDAMLDEKNKLITEYQAVRSRFYTAHCIDYERSSPCNVRTRGIVTEQSIITVARLQPMRGLAEIF